MGIPGSSNGRSLRSIDDLDDVDLDWLLTRAGRLADCAEPDAVLAGRVVGALFLTPSLRTRIGFAAAAARLGATTVEVAEPRWTPDMSKAESFAHTIRTLAGMVDVLVCRTPFPLTDAITSPLPAPVINGGDGARAHPTQALIDLFAIERFAGPVSELRIGVCGDLGSRSARSLLALLGRRPPAALTLVAPSGRAAHEVDPGSALAPRIKWTDRLQGGGLDVVYLTGLPERSGSDQLDDAARGRFAVTGDVLSEMADDAIVLSPMPVIDEISAEAWSDPRIRVFDQSDAGVAMRMAVLELVAGLGEPSRRSG